MVEKQRSSRWLQSLKSEKLASGGEEKPLVSTGVKGDWGGEFGLGPVDLQVRHQVWIQSLSTMCFSM